MSAVEIIDSSLATYSYTICNVAIAAGATDVWQLGGVAGQTKLRWIEVDGNAANERYQPVGLIRRSAVNTGGTSATIVPARASILDPQSGNVLTIWSANPTVLGVQVDAVVDQDTVLMGPQAFPAQAVPGAQDRVLFDYTSESMKSVSLDGSGDFMSINFQVGATAVNTLVTDRFDFAIWWTER